MQQLLAAVEDPMSPKKRRWADAQHRRCKQTKKEQPIVVGHRVQALLGAELTVDDIKP